MPIGSRLREERERLGMSQPAFAAIAKTTKQTLFSWESGKTAPDGFQLAALSEIGVDVLYILTGQRASAPASLPETTVSQGDKVLLDNFHAAPAQVQAGIKTALGAFAPGDSSGTAKQNKAA